MKELVTTEQAEHILRLLALVLPLAGIVIGALVGLVRKHLTTDVLIGFLFGLIGPGALGMWRVYNGIMGRYGLDSVKGLVINLVLFAVIGLLIGVGVGLARRRLTAPTRDAGSDI